MRRRPAGWLLALLAAGLALALLALLGEDRRQSLGRHEAAGLLREVAAEQVRELRLALGERRWRLVRDGRRWSGEPPLAASDTSIETALRLLRNAAPEREFEAEAAEFGFGPRALHLVVQTRDAGAYEIEFGAANPIGLARYTRVRHGAEQRSVLLPAYVAEAWMQVLGLGP